MKQQRKLKKCFRCIYRLTSPVPVSAELIILTQTYLILMDDYTHVLRTVTSDIKKEKAEMKLFPFKAIFVRTSHDSDPFKEFKMREARRS